VSNWTVAAERAGLIAVVVSLLFVGYEIKRNTDLAVVESQHDLLVLQVEMKGWFIDKEIRKILLADDIDQLQKDELQTLVYLAGSWFDLHEHVLLGYQRGVLSDEQMRVWSAGLCTFPPLWFEIFHTHINQDNYLDALVLAVKECQSALQTQ
jgi:hypothetical protein